MIEKKGHINDPSSELDPLTDEDGEVRELTAADFARAKPISFFPELADAMRRARGERGPQIAPVKQRVGLRLDADVLARFRESGKGWQARINDILKQHLNDAEEHKK